MYVFRMTEAIKRINKGNAADLNYMDSSKAFVKVLPGRLLWKIRSQVSEVMGRQVNGVRRER